MAGTIDETTCSRLGRVLLAHRSIQPDQLKRALEVQARTHERLGEILVRLGYLSEDLLVRALASAKGVRAWNLKSDPPTKEALKCLPMELCREFEMLPVQVRGDQLLVACSDPDHAEALDAARLASGLRVEPVLAHDVRLRTLIEQTFEGLGDQRSMDDLVRRALHELGQHPVGEAAEDLEELDTRPVVGLVNEIFAEAIRMRASDIHFEPRHHGVEVRYRLDGRLVPIKTLPRALMQMMIARIKILAELDIVEYRMPQDGRISLRQDGRPVDMRVSVLPNVHGPRVVIRILDRATALKSLSELGFHPHNLDLFQRLVRKPHGMILVTGPTGSGKSTTLYAALSELKSPAINIMTAEDPVEYDIPGINQSQVNEKVGLTFAEQLRSILRQDPDVVLVGEIRDEETAEVALRASLTGHLVLTTLHTNDALSAIPRMLDMGVKPHLLSTSVIGIMAQRLVRKLCNHCKEPCTPTAEERTVLGDSIAPIYRATGCAKCAQTGYRGRVAVNELLPVNGEISRLISESASTERVREAAHRIGFRPIQVDAVQRILDGETSFDEVSRVVFLDDVGLSAPA